MPQPPSAVYNIRVSTGYIDGYGRPSFNQYIINSNSAVPNPPAFDPANHPELYTGSALADNAKLFYKAEKNKLQFNAEMSWVPPTDPNFPHPAPVNMVGLTEDGFGVDSRGNMYTMPSGLADAMGLPLIDPASAAQVHVKVGEETQAATVPKTLADKLEAAGIPKTAKLLEAGPNSVKWESDYGAPVTTYVDEELASEADEVISGVKDPATGKKLVSIGKPEVDPGNPADPALPVVPEFDPTLDIGEEEPWPWSDWIAMLPFLDVLQGSSIELSGATSRVSVNLRFLGQHRNASFDFSSWEWLLRSMGYIIYACAAWYALQLALLKRD